MVGNASAGVLTEPTMVDNLPIKYVSDNGRYAAMSVFGSIAIMDLQTNKTVQVEGTEAVEYSFGHPGGSLSDDGIGVGYTSNSQAIYLDAKTGKITTLPTPTDGSFGAWAITPDGSMIVGYIGNRAENLDENEEDNTMCVPAIWMRNADGSYAQPIELPYPEKDFANRKPQYVMAGGVSADGTSIVGQMIDAFGGQSVPMYWTKKGDEWQYTILGEKLLNPNNVKFPDYYSAPEFPQAYLDFMTPEQQAAYDKAYEEWEQGGYVGDQPDFTNFMDEGAKEAYEAKLAVYQKWYDMFEEWAAAYQQCLDASPVYVMNDVMFNGSTAVFNATVLDDSDPEAFFPAENPIIVTFDVAANTHKFYEKDGLQATSVSYDGDILCYSGESGMMNDKMAYVIPAGTETPVEIAEWLKKFNEEYPEWIKENMTHEVTEWQEINGEWTEVNVEKTITGEPNSSNSFNLIALYNPKTWDMESEGFSYVSYLLPIDANTLIESVAASATENGPAVYYNLQGMRIENPARGIFIRVQNGESTKILVK